MRKGNYTNILIRYGLIVALIFLISALIIYKLVDTTIISADKWNAKAMEELSRIDTITPTRGNILAIDGSVLATNLRYYTARIDFRCEKFKENRYKIAIDSLADSMALYFPIRTAEQWRKHLKAPLEKPREKRSRHFRLIGNISYSDFQRLKTFPFFNIGNSNCTGLVKESSLRRVNPFGDMARRSIGGVGETAECHEIHGISGLEKALDTLLYGKVGYAKKVPLTKEIANWTDVAPRNGYDIRTTIDIKMQDIVENELNNMLEYCDADWGVAVLMEVSTGDIKAISNLERNPNGNGFIEGRNRAVLGFEPGSVVKTISMLIALEDGIVGNMDGMIQTGRAYAYEGGKVIRDSHCAAAIPLREVLERSSNIAMTKIITSRYASNPAAFHKRLEDIGFLDPMNTGIAGETTPIIPELPSNRGGRIALSRQCYGYATEIPPLYTLSIYNAIANGGKYVRPRLVAGIKNADIDSTMPITYIRNRICSETNAAKLREMLKRVVWGNNGTARAVRNDKICIAGKTGTAYMIENGLYNQSKKRLAFCGFFPADNPMYSCIVLTCDPKINARGPATTSGTVLKNIALKLYARGMLNHDSDFKSDIKPDTTPPVFFATLDRNGNKKLSEKLGYPNRMISTVPAVKTGVPTVIGFGLRDAVCMLEKAGYNVTFTGSGHVSSQSPDPGTEVRKGSKIDLVLTN